jgi:Rod binding protein
VGAAANAGQKGTIDKTSKLYEQALELESYFVKMMLSSMRNTVTKTSLTGENDFAGKMYDDMMYDELSRTVTKQAGFGLADQVYLELAGKS